MTRPLYTARANTYTRPVTKLLEQALEAVRRLPADSQDEIARAMLQLAASGGGF